MAPTQARDYRRADESGSRRVGPAPLRVLEIGCGVACSSVFDGRFVTGSDVLGVDVDAPDAATLQKAEAFAASRGHAFRFEQADATALRSLGDASVDTVVCSLTLCSVMPSVQMALNEVRRVLKPGGCFGFVEHVRVEKEDGRPLLAASQVVLDPLQQLLAHDCHLRRDTATLVVDAFGGPRCLVRPVQRMVNEAMWPVSQQAAGIVRKLG